MLRQWGGGGGGGGITCNLVLLTEFIMLIGARNVSFETL